MKKAFKVILIVIGVIGVIYGGLWIWVIVPSPDFEAYNGKPNKPDYWPTEGFRISTPEEQGMDSAKLLEIKEYCVGEFEKNSDFSIDSLAVYRNGYQVADFYFNPLFPRDTPHIINSNTKSIVSILVGIAVDQGYIASIDEPFVNYFPHKKSAVKDEEMLKISLKDLLTMETGIRSRDSATYRWVGNFEMQNTNDWVSFILGLPVDVEPGERFDYSNMSSFLLSAIIEEATGMDTLDFARENLFDPLGIEDVRWEWSPGGYAVGFARMWLKPEDMAKIGLLYLQQGLWDGTQIVPASWVIDSVTPHAFPKNYVKLLDETGNPDDELTTNNWRVNNIFRPFADGYGYQWWLDKDGSYAAVGVGGQYIMVVPEENLVFVTTSSASGFGVFFPRKILDKFVLPSIKSDTSLSANQEIYQRLRDEAGPPLFSNSEGLTKEISEMAGEISGNTYDLEKNNFRYDNFKLIFDTDKDYAIFSYTVNENDFVEISLGLNGEYLFSHTDLGAFAALGYWDSTDQFSIEIQQIGYSSSTRFELRFNGDDITVKEVGIVGTSNYSGRKK